MQQAVSTSIWSSGLHWEAKDHLAKVLSLFFSTSCFFSWVPRECNQPAHALCKWAAGFNCSDFVNVNDTKSKDRNLPLVVGRNDHYVHVA